MTPLSEHNLSPHPEHPWPGWQFGLQYLFVFTTLIAVAVSIATAFGPGTLFVTGGLILAWFNWSGAFSRLQSSRWQSLTLWLAWGLFLISLALPSFHVFSDVYGWGAAWLALMLPAEAIWSREIKFWPLLWFASIDVANLLAACLPILIWRLTHGRGEIYSAIFGTVMIGPWLSGCDLNMEIGFYVWVASFYVTLLAIPARSPTLAAMAAAALTALLATWADMAEF